MPEKQKQSGVEKRVSFYIRNGYGEIFKDMISRMKNITNNPMYSRSDLLHDGVIALREKLDRDNNPN